jgi:hypothetical protein
MRVEKVFITPLLSEGVYGAEVDVSAFTQLDGLSKIKRSIDSTDYTIGVYTFDDVKLKCRNADGTFNENDYRSIFPFARDGAKVRVEVLKIDAGDFSTETKIQFEGLLNDAATRQNITEDTIFLTALSKTSVFKTTQVPAGIITTGTTAKNAIFQILSQPAITALLTVDIDNINPELNFIVDSPSELDNLEVREALDLLVRASNSVLILEDDEIFVQEREKASPPATLELRGRGEITNNANIIGISEYNPGTKRQFNSVRLNDGAVTVEDSASVSEYGLRRIEFDFPMVADTDTLTEIGENIADEFRLPKQELKVRVPAIVAEDADLLDPVSVDAPLLRKPKPGNFLPVYGVATYGDPATPYPEVFGSVAISKNDKFKIISIEEDTRTFITTLKLRQAGKNTNDGQF